MSTCILIPTSTLYYNIWEPHMKLMHIYWNDCPFPIYLGTNKEPNLQYNLTEKYNVNYIFSTMEPKKDNILSRMLYYLEILQKKYKNVLLLIDDFFLTRNVDNNTMIECIKLLNNNSNIGMIRLYPSPEANTIDSDKYKHNDITNIYKRMKIMGIPEGLIRKTMIKNGVGHEIIDSFFGETPVKTIKNSNFNHTKNIKHRFFIPSITNYPNIKLGETYTDYICSHCLGNLTIQNICKLPHIDADLEDSRIITTHKKIDKIELNNTIDIWLQPTLWDLDFLIQGLKKMISHGINDFRKFETNGAPYYKNKLLLAPRYRWEIIYPCRGFCGGGVFSGVISKWALQLFKKYNIHIPLYDNNYIFDITKIKSNHDKIGKKCNIEYAEKI